MINTPRARRAVLGALGWGAAALACAPRARASAYADGSVVAQQWRALSRLGYGPTPGAIDRLQAAASPQAWALAQIDAAYSASRSAPPMDPELRDIDAALPDIFDGVRAERQERARIRAGNADPAQDDAPRHYDLSAPAAGRNFSRAMAQKTAAWRLEASAQPDWENALLARMTEFWFNHLNVYIGKGQVRPFVGHYLIHVVRAHALGPYEELLLASARHPAMLFYLDQAQSVANGTLNARGEVRGLNENYARELMELHTLGVNGGYNQSDVRELARVLSGWTVGPRDPGGFRFVARSHDYGDKTVLGQHYPAKLLERGEREGEQAIRMLARHPSTAHRISLRLAQFLVADQPSPALVQRLAQTFLDTQGDTRAVLRVLVAARDFWDPDNRLFKTPMDYACSALAAVQGAQDRRKLMLTAGFLNNAGQPLHGWQTPDGYKTDAATWLAPEALTRRADFALALARRSGDLEFLQTFLGPATRASIAQQAPELRAGLALASPEFMYK